MCQSVSFKELQLPHLPEKANLSHGARADDQDMVDLKISSIKLKSSDETLKKLVVLKKLRIKEGLLVNFTSFQLKYVQYSISLQSFKYVASTAWVCFPRAIHIGSWALHPGLCIAYEPRCGS